MPNGDDLESQVRGMTPWELHNYKRELVLKVKGMRPENRDAFLSRLQTIPELSDISHGMGRLSPVVTQPQAPADIEPEMGDISLWQKGLEYAFYPFTLTGMSLRGAKELPGQFMESLKEPGLGLLPSEERPLWGRPEPTVGLKEGFQQILPGGERFEEYRELPMWQQLLWESPAFVGAAAAPGFGALRGGIKGAGLLPKLGRAALGPATAVEAAPGKVLGAVGKKIFKPKVAETVINQLPYKTPELTPYKARKQIDRLAAELSEHLGAPPIQPTKVITQETTRLNLWNRIGEKAKGMVNRTYRVEPLLLRADTYLERGKMQQVFWDSIDGATNKKIAGIYNTVDELKGLLKNNNINIGKVLGAKTTIDDITLTSSERVGVYLHSLNADNLVHIVFGNNIPARTITKIVDSLTPEEKLVADFLQKYFVKETPRIAAAVKLATGKPMQIVENYFPIRIKRDVLAELGLNQLFIDERKARYATRWASARIRKGFTLPRTGKAMQPIELDSLSIFLRHIEGIEHYKAFEPLVKNLQVLINRPKFRNAFVKKEGSQAHQVLEQWLKDVAQTDPLGVSRQADRMLRSLRVNAVTAVLGWNITTAMKQFPSFISGMAEVGELAALRGLFTFLRHPKETIGLVKELAPQIYKRRFEREIAEAAVMKGLQARITGKLSIKEVFMLLTTTIDRLAVNSLWRGAFDDALRGSGRALKATGKTTGEKLSVQEAAEYATRGVRRTQPFFGIKDVPEYWRSGEFMKALTIFTNQLNQYWNYYRFQIIGKKAAGQISTLEAGRRIIETFIVPAIFIGAITRSKPAENIKEFVTDLTSMGLATVPIIGSWITSGVKGFQPSGLITTELLEQLQRFGYNANKGNWDKIGAQIPEIGGYLMGYPVAQPRRTIKAVMDLATDKSDDWMSLIWGTYTRERAAIDPDEQIEDEVWAQYPSDYRKISEKIKELEKTDMQAARRLQIKYPGILRARETIARAKNRLKQQEQLEERRRQLEGK